MDQRQRGRPKDKEKAAAILDAAGDAFTENGMSHTTMQDIAKKAGVSKLTVYNNFGTKEELFKKVIQKKCMMHMGDDILNKARRMPPRDGLCFIGLGFIGIIFSEEAIAIHRTVMAESRHDNTISRLFYDSGPERVFKIVGQYLNLLEKDGVCVFDNIDRASEVFLSLFTGATHMRTVLKLEPAPDQNQLEVFCIRKC